MRSGSEPHIGTSRGGVALAQIHGLRPERTTRCAAILATTYKADSVQPERKEQDG